MKLAILLFILFLCSCSSTTISVTCYSAGNIFFSDTFDRSQVLRDYWPYKGVFDIGYEKDNGKRVFLKGDCVLTEDDN